MDDDPQPVKPKRTTAEKRRDNCGRLVQVFFFIVMVIATLSSVAVVTNCEFVSFEIADGTAGPIDGITFSTATFGMTRWNPDNQGCRKYISTDYSTEFRTARICAFLAFVCGAFCAFLLLIEIICIRLCGSRLGILMLCILAFILQAMTAIIYGKPECKASGGGPYRCQMDTGTSWTIAASCLYLLGAMMACPTPKSLPLVSYFMEIDRSKRHIRDSWWCCCLHKAALVADALDEEDEEEAMLAGVSPVVAFHSVMDERRVLEQDEEFILSLPDGEEKDAYMAALNYQKEVKIQQMKPFMKPEDPVKEVVEEKPKKHLFVGHLFRRAKKPDEQIPADEQRSSESGWEDEEPQQVEAGVEAEADNKILQGVEDIQDTTTTPLV